MSISITSGRSALLGDPHGLLPVGGLADHLDAEDDFEVVGEAGDGAAAVRFAARSDPTWC